MIYQGNAVSVQLLDDGIAELKFDLQGESVNKFDRATLEDLSKATEALKGNDQVKGIVVTSGKKVFIVGADITEFGKPPVGPSLPEVIDTIEASDKPVVAAIHGTALGGGLETAMAAHYRVGDPGSRYGLPEVKLGLLPGAGGTQRLPRVTGAQKALEMMTSGDMIGADDHGERITRQIPPFVGYPSFEVSAKVLEYLKLPLVADFISRFSRPESRIDLTDDHIEDG